MNRLASPSLRTAACLVSFAAILLAVGGCKRTQSTPPPPKAPEVYVAAAVEDTVTDHEDFTGRLEAMKKVDLQSRVTGYLKEVHFAEGGDVVEGEVLFEIDPTPYVADLKKAQAALVMARAKLLEPQDKRKRAEDLFEQKAGTVEALESAKAIEAVAIADIAVAESNVEIARTWLDYTIITAPFNGKVSRTAVDPNNLIKADSTVLTTVVSDGDIFGYFDVDERTHLRLRRLQAEKKLAVSGSSRIPVRLALADKDEFEHEGYIDFEDIAIDPATGTRRMRGVFGNAQNLLMPGLFVRVRLQIGEPHPAVLVPEQAVGIDQGNKFVYVVDKDNRVEYRGVTTGALVKGQRVIESNLKAGERVVVSGLQKIRLPAAGDTKSPRPQVVPREWTRQMAPTKGLEPRPATIEKK